MSFWDSLRERLEAIGADIGNWVPKIIGALLILIIGLFIARILRRITRRILEAEWVGKVVDSAGIGPSLRNAGYSVAELGASVVYFFFVLIVLLLTATALEVQAIIDLLERLIAFVPVVIIALLLVVIASAVGRFLADLSRPWAETHNYGWLPTLIHWAFVIFGIFTAFDLVGVGSVSEDVRRALLLALGVAFAVAFGVGGIDTARNWWGKYLSPRDTSPRDTV